MHIDKLDDIVNKYDNTYHRTIKKKPVDVKSSTYSDFNKENNKEGSKQYQNKKYQNIKAFLQKALFQISLKKLKTLCCGHVLLVILTEKKLPEHSMKKSCKKQIKKSLDLNKY